MSKLVYLDNLYDKACKLLDLEDKTKVFEVVLKMILLVPCISINKMFAFIFIPGILFKKIVFKTSYWVITTLFFFWYYVYLGLEKTVANHIHIYCFMMLMGTIAVYLYNKNLIWDTYLSYSTRMLIGLIFFYATIGKFMSFEFLDGSMFEYILYNDPRFAGFTNLILGENSDVLTQNNTISNTLLYTNNPFQEVVLQKSDIIEKLAVFMVYWTIIIEGLLALAFLLPKKYFIAKLRDLVLLLFVITTYPIATVTGFAMSLVLLAFTHSYFNNGFKHLYTFLYILIFVLSSLFMFPFAIIFQKLIP